MTMNVPPGPFEDGVDVQVLTYSCPCNTHHNREEFRQSDRSFRQDGAQHRILLCPADHLVYMKYGHIDPGGGKDPVYAEIEVEAVPIGAVLV